MKPGNELLFLALGGSGEIGMNVNLYGCEGKWLMVDCGITFGDASYPGVDIILPDLQFIEERLDDLIGIVLTHGHEDHIGALPYLAGELGVPLYATPFTAGLIAGKLEEEGNADRIELNVVKEEGAFNIGPFKITYMPLAHSIPEGNAVLIETPYGKVFHTGDWKLDETPALGGASTAEELTAVGDKGVLALVCDSTNVFNPEASGSEGAVRIGLEEVVSKVKGRVLVTTFASNAARLQTLGEVAQATGRQICVAGRSLDRILRVAKTTGYLRDFPETVDFETAMTLPPHKLMIVATGGQGEARAALNRIAEDSHVLKVHKGDTVIFSSRQIPGNEVAIGRIMNVLAGKGVELITDRQAFVHVSGHPGRPELAEMYKWIRPEIILPVHGEVRHMQEHSRFALSQGVPQAINQVNGDIWKLAPGKPKPLGKAPVGRLVLDGDVILPADGTTINERRRLALYGQISAAVAIRGRKLAGRPQIRIQGVPVEEDRDDFLAEASEAAAQAVSKDSRDLEKMREAVRLAVRRVAVRFTGKKPIVDVLILEV